MLSAGVRGFDMKPERAYLRRGVKHVAIRFFVQGSKRGAEVLCTMREDDEGRLQLFSLLLRMQDGQQLNVVQRGEVKDLDAQLRKR